jgi:putative transposase
VLNGLKGFQDAILAVYPQAQIQRCIIHQIRSSTRYVSYKDIKSLMKDLKLVYQAVTEDEALENLRRFKAKWSKSYPSCVKSREDNWQILSTFYAYPAEIRKIIYTTNIIEGLNRQFRRITKIIHSLRITIPCVKCCIWRRKRLSNIGPAGVEIGTRF